MARVLSNFFLVHGFKYPCGPLPMAGPGPLPMAVKMVALLSLSKSSGKIRSQLFSSLPGAALGSKLFASCSSPRLQQTSKLSQVQAGTGTKNAFAALLRLL